MRYIHVYCHNAIVCQKYTMQTQHSTLYVHTISNVVCALVNIESINYVTNLNSRLPTEKMYRKHQTKLYVTGFSFFVFTFPKQK